MNTPVLSKQQQKHTLSAKRTPARGLRNVLAQPQDNFWPIVNDEKSPALENLISKLMSVIKRSSCTLPWSQLRHMKKNERAQAKKEALSKEGNIPNTEIVSSVILGINAVTRSLEKNNVCCVLMEANIDPPFLVKHIVLMAESKKIPILLLPNLKTITLNIIGFACAACALKHIVKESTNHHFHPLYKTICDTFKEIPLPKNSLLVLEDTETWENPMPHETDNKCTEIKDEIASAETPKFSLSTDVYKYRSSRKERAFIPPSAVVNSTDKPLTETAAENDFIPLTNYDSDGSDTNVKEYSREGKNQAQNVRYLPLKVKRLQGNSNRVKATKFSKQKKK